MLKFIVRFLAVIGFFTLLLVVGLFARARTHAEPEPNSIILTIDFTKPIVEQNESSPLDFAIEDQPLTLLDVLHAIGRAASDPHVKGLAARFGDEQPALAAAQEIRSAVAHFRAAGKFTYAYGSDFGEYGTGNRAYYLASAFENIWLQPVGTVSLTGVAIHSPFAKAALDKIGITADFMQREEYKSFMEMGQRTGFSPLVKDEMKEMVEDLSNQLADGIASSRNWDASHVKDLMARGPYTDEEALSEGLITKLAYADELDDELDGKTDKEAKQVNITDYLNYVDDEKVKNKTTIAVIYGTGLIMDKAVGEGNITGEHVMGADDIANAFDDASDDKDVKAILFRIDSPGGSPAASETIRRAMIHVQKQGKPVIVSMGETAASGGYWIAMNGDKIIADPATLTGSIGVVAGKFVIDELLKKAGISMDGVATEDNAGMWDMTTSYTPQQRARVNALLDNTYHSFISDVSSARHIPMEKMPLIAKGRVFTGAQAIKLGLVDELGGYEEAFKAIRTALKLEDNNMLFLENFPATPTAAERLMKLMRRLGSESAVLSSSLMTLAKIESVLSPWSAKLNAYMYPVNAHMQGIENKYE